jgi:class 3 adenylate cyclase
VAAPLRVSSTIRLQVPLDRLWEFLADTERLNRAVDLPAITFVPLPDPAKKGYYRAETRFLGMKLSYDELPFEWVRGRYYRVERRFRSGPLESVVAGIRCSSEGASTELEVFADIVPRNLVGNFVARKVVGRKATQDFIELARAFERHVTRDGPPPALPAPADLHPDVLDARLKLVDAQFPSRRLRDHLLAAPDLEVVRMRPFELADRWGEERTSTLRLFLHAAKAGVLDLNWSVLCPSCRVAVKQTLTLSQLESKAHCETCRVEFGTDLARSIEARFTVNAGVRPARREIYCIGGPANTPQIQAQLRLRPRERRREEFPIPPGTLRVRCYQAPGILPLVGTSIRVGADGLRVEPGPAGALEVENALDVEALLVVERETWKDGAATAAMVTSMQDFRDLFPGEAVAPGEELGIESLAVLFTDLKGSTELYQKLGDAKAFGFVQTHFRYLTEAVARHRGGVVKTMGDAVMAIFASGKDAVQAGVEMQRSWNAFRGERFNTIQRERMGVAQHPKAEFDGISLKVGIHQGSAIAINNAGKLDYFGTMVNKAARVQAQSAGDDVVFSRAVAEDPAVRAYLTSEGLAEEIVSVPLKGLEGDHVLHRVRPSGGA